MKETISFADRVQEDLIFLNVPGDTKEQVLKSVADKLLAMGVVKGSYYGALMLREKDYPTGLLIGEHNIAIPHTYPQHINKNAIVIAIPEKPVIFQSMEDPDQEVTVSLLVCPLLEKIDDNVKLLPSLIKFFVNENTVTAILQAKTPQDVMKIVRA